MESIWQQYLVARYGTNGAALIGSVLSTLCSVLVAICCSLAWIIPRAARSPPAAAAKARRRTVHLHTPPSHGWSQFVIAFSAGALLADVTGHILPELYTPPHSHHHPHHHTHSGGEAGVGVLTGIAAFFILESFISLWESAAATPSAAKRCATHTVHESAWLNLAADAVHNLADGVAVSASFLAGARAGVATSVAVCMHEIPQEMGDYGVLLRAGLEPWRALLLNAGCACSSLLGNALVFALVHYSSGSRSSSSNVAAVESVALDRTQRRVLSFAAGGLLYMALSSLLPQLQQSPAITSRTSFRAAWGRRLGVALLGLVVGALAVTSVGVWEHSH
ncbi:hypothetical protein CDCA_CDCA07G2052 [Cyanidium caldarium]|uniref:Zinc transporter n=1 Tax=Cyanidium caldarium TaxID=2771 RepID=A0AAV9IUL5_CYACA|nr:hypothetical protein CDCA_CDCA07G2052 [Cyanidium caldarium]